MKFNVAYPLVGTQKSFEIDDDNKCRIFFEKRLGQEVEADLLGEEFKGYVFKICGGNDKDGFPMKQGVFSNGRIRLLLSTGTSCYRPGRKGERKRKSVRGCIVGPDIAALSLSVTKKGEKEIPGLTDASKPRRLGPKRISGIRKLYGLERSTETLALVKKNVIRRTFASKKTPTAAQRQKAPKIQRIVTEARLRRKKLIKKTKIDRSQKTAVALAEYQKLYSEWVDKKHKDEKARERALAEKKAEESKPVEKKPVVEKKGEKPAKPTKPVLTKPVATTATAAKTTVPAKTTAPAAAKATPAAPAKATPAAPAKTTTAAKPKTEKPKAK